MASPCQLTKEMEWQVLLSTGGRSRLAFCYIPHMSHHACYFKLVKDGQDIKAISHTVGILCIPAIIKRHQTAMMLFYYCINGVALNLLVMTKLHESADFSV